MSIDELARKMENNSEGRDERCKECGCLMSVNYGEDKQREYLEIKCSNDECRMSKPPFIRRVTV